MCSPRRPVVLPSPQVDKRWIPSENIRVTAVGNERVVISGPTPPACSVYADKLGSYRRVKGQEVHSHAFYQRPESDTMLWHAAGVWWIGPAASVGKQSGFWRCQVLMASDDTLDCL